MTKRNKQLLLVLLNIILLIILFMPFIEKKALVYDSETDSYIESMRFYNIFSAFIEFKQYKIIECLVIFIFTMMTTIASLMLVFVNGINQRNTPTFLMAIIWYGIAVTMYIVLLIMIIIH